MYNVLENYHGHRRPPMPYNTVEHAIKYILHAQSTNPDIYTNPKIKNLLHLINQLQNLRSVHFKYLYKHI